MKSKFTPKTDIVWYDKRKKFVSLSTDKPLDGNTFCLDNKIMNIMLENQDNCRFFNITKEDGSNDWWWGYSYNLMFQAIDFDWDSDVWLCKVIGYIE